MHKLPKRAIPVLLVVILSLTAGAVYFLLSNSRRGEIVFSGTIEATEIRLGAEMGGRVNSVFVNEGEKVTAGQVMAEVRNNGAIKAPVNGTVLQRLAEPGEVVGAGGVVLLMADLEALTLTVYVPENRYGQILLGQTYPVTVDSFTGENFEGTVTYIADQAEFTPRNVQAIDNRKTTVFAIRLSLPQTGGRLKPGMPADVIFINR